jgi:FkbM family methyltransferase
VALRLNAQLVLFGKRLVYGRRGEPYTVDGHTLRYVPGTRPVRASYMKALDAVARYDALQVAWLCANLNEGDHALDVGACYGAYSILMAAKCGHSGSVTAFEPDPQARRVLATNLRLNPALRQPTVESYACSDVQCQATLFSCGGNSQSSLARSAVEKPNASRAQEISVSLVTLDSYIERHCSKPIRCVKIDTEGAEIRILKGASRLLAGSASIICELHPYAWPELGNSLDELKSLVQDSGRRLRYLDEDRPIGDHAHYGTVALEQAR